jgi:hypothetical protein
MWEPPRDQPRAAARAAPEPSRSVPQEPMKREADFRDFLAQPARFWESL